MGRHGAQKAVENCTSVARWPSGPPRSALVSTSGLAAGRRVARGCPARRAEPPGPAAQRQPEHRCRDESRDERDQPASHANPQHARGVIHSRGRRADPADRCVQVGVAVSSTWWLAVIWKLLIVPAVLAIEPAYQTLPSSRAVVQPATWVRVPSGWTTHSWQVVPIGMRSTRTLNASPHCSCA